MFLNGSAEADPAIPHVRKDRLNSSLRVQFPEACFEFVIPSNEGIQDGCPFSRA